MLKIKYTLPGKVGWTTVKIIQKSIKYIPFRYKIPVKVMEVLEEE